MTTTASQPATHPSLTDLVSAQLGVPAVPTTVTVDEVAYDVPSLTTAGRHIVRGRARAQGVDRDFGFFVKHVRSAAHSPMVEALAEHLRQEIGRSLPWRIEPALYASDLADRLPAGVVMPRCYDIVEEDDAAVMWLELVEVTAGRWSARELARAAYLLGRLAASEAVRPLAPVAVGLKMPSAREYVEGRASHQLLPVLADPATWRHRIAAPFLPLRERLLREVARVDEHVQLLESTPVGAAHGDASPNNLLHTRSGDDLTLIDFGYWSPQPLGHDLGQLLVGDVQLGNRPASCLAADEEIVRPAYLEGLRDEGVRLDHCELLRAHASQLLVFTGLSLLPDVGTKPELTAQDLAVAEARAEALAFVLALVDSARDGRHAR